MAEHAAERILVGAPRPPRRPVSPRRRRVDASGAGLVLLVLIVLFAAAGAWLGNRFGVGTSGAIMGTVLGLPLAFAGVYLRFRQG